MDSFKYHSEENISTAVSESSPPISIGAQCSPQFGPTAPQSQHHQQPHQHHLQPRAADDQRAITNDHNMTLSILKQLEQGREMQAELQDVIADLQVYVLPMLSNLSPGLSCVCYWNCILLFLGKVQFFVIFLDPLRFDCSCCCCQYRKVLSDNDSSDFWTSLNHVVTVRINRITLVQAACSKPFNWHLIWSM